MKDLRPIAVDMTLCNSAICANKCKRHEIYWRPQTIQRYITPTINYDKDGKQLPCGARKE